MRLEKRDRIAIKLAKKGRLSREFKTPVGFIPSSMAMLWPKGRSRPDWSKGQQHGKRIGCIAK
jgi:hypothetical protein